MEKPVPPINILLSLAFAGITIVLSLLFMPAAELIPAQLFPEKKISGESFVPELPGANQLMKLYADTGLVVVDLCKKLNLQQSRVSEGGERLEPSAAWQKKLEAVHDDSKAEAGEEKYSGKLKQEIESRFGGADNVKTVLTYLDEDKNFIYNAYALFLGLALLAGAVGIQAMGRLEPVEKTILPSKK